MARKWVDYKGVVLEARVGIEPTNKGFADLFRALKTQTPSVEFASFPRPPSPISTDWQRVENHSLPVPRQPKGVMQSGTSKHHALFGVNGNQAHLN